MKEHDIVKSKLDISIPKGIIPKGSKGTIVHVYNAQSVVVEFVDEAGKTIDVVDVNKEDLQKDQVVLEVVLKFLYRVVKFIFEVLWWLLKYIIKNILWIYLYAYIAYGFYLISKEEEVKNNYLFLGIILSVLFCMDYVDNKIKKEK